MASIAPGFSPRAMSVRAPVEHVEPASVEVGGFAAPGFESVSEVFGRNFAERGEVGAAFAAYVDGEAVVDLWGGLADRRQGVAWQRDTLVGIFSGTKGLVATCLLLLLERGQLRLDVPVSRYWPEFGAEGKEHILVADVVSHQAGLPGLMTPVSVKEATNDRRMAQLVALQRPLSRPCDGPRYHALTFGWLCGELIRRVDGRSVGRFLREEIGERLDLDLWIGLPAQHKDRVAVIERSAGFQRELEQIASERDADRILWSILSNPPRFSGTDVAANDPRWRAAEIPATNGIATARSLARLYGCLARGGELDGIRLISPATIENGRRCLARGHDPYLDEPQAFATGFELQTKDMPFGPVADAFGHRGAGGSVHGAWPEMRTGFSYAPNLLASFGEIDTRGLALLRALHTARTNGR